MANIGVIVVHGIGDQARYELLREVSSAFYRTFKRLLGGRHSLFLVDRRELNRRAERPEDASDAAGAGRPASTTTLFRPVTIRFEPGLPGGGAASVGPHDEIRFYEAYWADEALRFTAYEKVKFNLWLTTTAFNPIFNALHGRYLRPPFSRARACLAGLRAVALALVYHLAELCLVLVAFVFRRTEPLNRWGERIYAFAGDVKLYVSQRVFFHNQTKREVILARFDEVLIKAFLENEHVHVIGHSLGSVIAFDGLMRHAVQPSKMSDEFQRYLDGVPAPITVDVGERLRSFVSVGSPLDKMYCFWPRLRRFERQPAYVLERQTEGSETLSWRARVSGPGSAIKGAWLNVVDSVDPIGARLECYDEIRDFPKPANQRFARCFLPSSGHTRYWENDAFMEQLVRLVHGSALAEPPPPPAEQRPGLAAVLARAAFCALLGLVSVVAIGSAFFWLLDFSLSVAHDLIMDAESHTIYTRLGWLDALLALLRSALGMDTRDLATRLARLGSWAALATLAGFALSAFFFRRADRVGEERLRADDWASGAR